MKPYGVLGGFSFNDGCYGIHSHRWAYSNNRRVNGTRRVRRRERSRARRDALAEIADAICGLETPVNPPVHRESMMKTLRADCVPSEDE